MSKRKHSNRKSLLTSPGTLTYIGPEIELDTIVSRIRYSPDLFESEIITRSDEARSGTGNTSESVTWYNVEGIHNTGIIARLGKNFGIHPLVLEDILNTNQKPKLEAYEDASLFLVLKMLHYETDPAPQETKNKLSPKITTEHICFILRNNFLLSFQEEIHGNAFHPVENRLKASVGKTRSNKADYLLFALMDVVIDNYFIVLEKLEERIELIENDVIQGSGNYQLKEFYALKQDLTLMRRSVFPLREMISGIIRDNPELISPGVVPYFRDLYDHVIQVTESIDSYRDLLTGLVDVHLSSMSHRMNQVMKTLTIFSAIFMPLTFIVGVYGMNFQYMPELSKPYGYFVTWGVMLLISLAMYGYFKWKKWT